ncbi:DNA-binding protein [reindeer adenovirus 1]|uniref:DNA-binding protein n=1 Tax=reindeer adenovirus 1 TaxID=2885353 RepID=A0AAE9C1P0_9ADEN|nr:DNA-binding protein [reindeer adenovirus 1]
MNRSGDLTRATSSADSSGDENPLIIDETPRKKASRKRRAPAAEPPAEDATAVMRAKIFKPQGLPKPAGGAARPSAGGASGEGPAPALPAASKAMLEADEVAWQRAMELAVGLCLPLKVDIKNLTLLPDTGTLECFRKAAQSWLNESKVYLPLTFSTQKTVLTVMARFLYDFVLKAAGLGPSSWNPTGCVVWRHQCTDGGQGILHCLHGLPMLSKDQVIEMDVNSENGQRALKETPHKTKITTNRWNRNVVQLKNEDAACCHFDAALPAGSFSSKSCGMFFSEGPKALQAFWQIMSFQKACYPKMQSAGSHLLMPIKCDCNWGHLQLPLLGRQVCKVTPFNINAGSAVDKALVDDPKLLASVEYPSVLVFQCCNPVYRQTRANSQRNCDFKISAPDMISAVQLVKQMWSALVKQSAPITIPEFRWDAQFQHQNVILPIDQYDADESLF